MMDANLVEFKDIPKVFKVRKKKKNCKTTAIDDATWISNRIPPPTREYRIYPAGLLPGRTRICPYRIDFAWPKYRVAVEVEGGVFSGGRHTRGVGYIGDMVKYNYITGELGWVILRYTPTGVDYAQVFKVIQIRMIISAQMEW